MLTAPPALTTIDSVKSMPKGIRDLGAPSDLKIPFWSLRPSGFQPIDAYSTEYWFMGMKKATKKAYKTHQAILQVLQHGLGHLGEVSLLNSSGNSKGDFQVW
jgi:hypothetical protein